MNRFVAPAAASVVVGLLLGAAAIFGITLMIQQDTKPALPGGDQQSQMMPGCHMPRGRLGHDRRLSGSCIGRPRSKAAIAVGDVDGPAVGTYITQTNEEIMVRAVGGCRQHEGEVAYQLQGVGQNRAIEGQHVASTRQTGLGRSRRRR